MGERPPERQWLKDQSRLDAANGKLSKSSMSMEQQEEATEFPAEALGDSDEVGEGFQILARNISMFFEGGTTFLFFFC